MSWNLDAIATLYGVTLAKQNERITQLEQEVARLKELLKSQLSDRFGKSSEKSDLPNDDESDDSSKGTITVSAHTRQRKKGKGRRLSTDHLPSFDKVYDLPVGEQTCSGCQENLHVIKTHKTEQLEIIPVRYCVVNHIQFIYGCRNCNTVVTPPKPLPPIPKAIPGSSLLAEIIIHKYQNHQPLYRQSKQMKYNDIDIPDNTLGNWVIKVGFGLQPLYEAMWCILKQSYLQVDETPVKLLDPDKKGYLWAYYAPHIGDDRGLVVFELSETREGDVVSDRLKTFSGLLQTDAYAGYQSLRNQDNVTGVGCFTHARRKFKEVIKISKDENGIAAQMLEKMKPLYQLEERMKKKKLNFHTKKRLRQRIAKPITKDIHRWLRSVEHTVPPKSKLGKAIKYTLKQWPYLIAYLRHGMAEIDTNNVENLIREIALGKKNWLFIKNSLSGIVHAIFFSLIISCVLNGINARVYMHYVIDQIHGLRQGKVDPYSLLPHTIDKSLLKDFAQQQMDFAKQLFNSS